MTAPGPAPAQTIVFFDGVCHLCNGFVDFAISHDRKGALAFAPLQGQTARRVLPVAAEPAALDSVIWWSEGRILQESAAVARVLIALGGAWSIAGWLLRLTPGFLANPFYRFVARHRYAWFGQREFCRLPQPHERGRLLD